MEPRTAYDRVAATFASRIRLATAVVITGVLLVADGAAAATTSFTIHTRDGFVTRIGPFRTLGSRTAGSLARAREVFGRPTSLQNRYGGNSCVVEWRALRLRWDFASYGLHQPCDSSMALQRGTIRSTRFRTTGGVRVGSRSSTIQQKHHGAVFEDGGWTIASAEFPYGDSDEPTPTVRALVSGGRVVALTLFVGAAGD